MKLIKTTLTDAQAAKLLYDLDLPEDDVPAGTIYFMRDDIPPAGIPAMPGESRALPEGTLSRRLAGDQPAHS